MRWKWFLAGVISFPVMAGLVTWVALKTRADGWSARKPPTRLEAWLANEARRLAVPPTASAARGRPARASSQMRAGSGLSRAAGSAVGCRRARPPAERE